MWFVHVVPLPTQHCTRVHGKRVEHTESLESNTCILTVFAVGGIGDDLDALARTVLWGIG